MKSILVITTAFLPLFALAGGGGGLRPTASQPMSAFKVAQAAAILGGSGGGGVLGSTNGGGPLVSKEIIFHIGQDQGLVKFAYGHLVDKQWQIQKLEMPETELAIDPAVVKALQDSKALNSWAPIK